MTCVKRIGLLLAALLLNPRAASADEHHYQDYLIGERAVGFGGAFSALADDSSSVFYNPAGLSLLNYSSLNLQAAVYGVSRSSFALESELIVGGKQSQTASGFATYPTTAVWIQKLRDGRPNDGVGRVVAALSLITPSSSALRNRYSFAIRPQQQGNEVYQRTSLTANIAEDDTLWVGLSAAFKPTSWLHLGATLYATWRTGVYQFYEMETIAMLSGNQVVDVDVAAQRVGVTMSHYGLIGMLGALLELGQHFRVGLTFRTPQLRLTSSAKATLMGVSTTEGGDPRVEGLDLEGDFHHVQPFKTTLALAYTHAGRFSLAVDLSLHGASSLFHLLEIKDAQQTYELFPIARRLTLQLNLGGELYLSRHLALRGGFFTNLSSYEGPSSCADDDQSCKNRLDNPFADAGDRLGLAAAIGYELQRATLTLGASYTFGSSSEALASNLKLERSRSLLFFMLGGSFRF